MLKSSLCDYSDAYILVKKKKKLLEQEIMQQLEKGVSFKNCAPFTNCISEINNTQIDNAKDIDIAVPKCNVIEYSDNYAKTSGSLWQYYKDEPNNNLTDSESFKSKLKITGKSLADGNEKDVEIKNYNVMINGANFIDQPIKNNKVTYGNIRKIATGQGNDYTTGSLLDYS